MWLKAWRVVVLSSGKPVFTYTPNLSLIYIATLRVTQWSSGAKGVAASMQSAGQVPSSRVTAGQNVPAGDVVTFHYTSQPLARKKKRLLKDSRKHLRTPIAKALEAIIIVDCSSSRAALGAGDSHHAPVLPA